MFMCGENDNDDRTYILICDSGNITGKHGDISSECNNRTYDPYEIQNTNHIKNNDS